MSKRPLILLSFSYPYGYGETFLGNEISHLAETFDPFFIVPMLPEPGIRPFDTRAKLIEPNAVTVNMITETLRGILKSDGMFWQEWKNSPYFPTSPLIFYRIARTLGIARRLEQNILDLVKKHNLKDGIIYSYWMNQSCIGGILAAKKLGWKVVTRTHRGDLYPDEYKGQYLPWHKWKVKNLDYIFAISDYCQEYLKNTLEAAPDKVVIHRYGVRGRGVIQHEPGTNNTFHIVSCSSFIPRKRVKLIFETVKLLAQKAPHYTFKWSHFGTGPEFDEIKSQVDALNISNLSIYLAGQTENDALFKYYVDEKADYFINYSTSEGLPVSIIEATSCGLPIAAPHTDGIPELIDEENGIVFPLDATPEMVSDLLVKDLNPAILKKKSEASFARWKRDHEIDTVYTKFTEFLSGI